MGFAGRQNVIVRFGLLQDAPHPFDIIAGVAPVALGVKIAQKELVLKPQMDGGDRAGDFARDEGFGPRRPFMIEEDAVRRMHPIGFAIIDRDPIGVELGGGVGRARIEGRRLALRDRLHFAVELRRRGLIETRLRTKIENADRLEKAKRAERVGIGGIFRRLEAHLDMALRGEIVDFVGLHFLDDADQIRRIRQIAVMQKKIAVCLMRIMVQMIDAIGVDQRGPPLHAMHNIIFRKEKFGEKCAVLTRGAGNQGNFLGRHDQPILRSVTPEKHGLVQEAIGRCGACDALILIQSCGSHDLHGRRRTLSPGPRFGPFNTRHRNVIPTRVRHKSQLAPRLDPAHPQGDATTSRGWANPDRPRSWRPC